MIVYQNKRIWMLRKIVVMQGSVFPWAMVVALPGAMVACVMKVAIDAGGLDSLRPEDSILRETQAWSGFTFLVGFLIVFRTSQSYNRFWDGCTSIHRMRAEWLDSVSSFVAFSEFAKGRVAPEKTKSFKGKLIRLFSMLHSVALAELEVMGSDFPPIGEVASFRFEVLDPLGLDERSLRHVLNSHSKVQLLYSWIQCLIVQNIRDEVLSIPPPILSRAFQEIANGMVAFHDAMKISSIPFPFPYTQTCDCLLIMHWVVVPFVTTQWVTTWVWAGVFVFIQTFVLWSLNFIAIEIENPFGGDPNDLDGRTMQMEMNQHLLLLVRENSTRIPSLIDSHSWNEASETGTFSLQSLFDVSTNFPSEPPRVHKPTVSPCSWLRNLTEGQVSHNPMRHRWHGQHGDSCPSPVRSFTHFIQDHIPRRGSGSSEAQSPSSPGSHPIRASKVSVPLSEEVLKEESREEKEDEDEEEDETRLDELQVSSTEEMSRPMPPLSGLGLPSSSAAGLRRPGLALASEPAGSIKSGSTNEEDDDPVLVIATESSDVPDAVRISIEPLAGEVSRASQVEYRRQGTPQGGVAMQKRSMRRKEAPDRDRRNLKRDGDSQARGAGNRHPE